jgi:maltooligosyltrehalose trehalohydrolase
MRYRLRLDQGEAALPDPASRFQPEGPHGPSEIVDPGDFAWTDGAWRGRTREQLVIYEMHVGTFTPDGSWEVASRELPALAELGITCLEIMPVAEFAGRFGWGYDGVNLFAPTRLYGRPIDFRRFVDRAHALGIAVILDVVYNHFGPDGNYLKSFSPAYFTDRHDNDWGEAINFDGAVSGPVREFFVANAGFWIDEYHLDGLRLDATQAIYDRSEDHILAAIVRQVRSAARGRITFVVAENEPQHAKLARPVERGGYGLDALWNDEIERGRAARLLLPLVALPLIQEPVFCGGDELARATAVVRIVGLVTLPAECFVVFLQNHDQVANSGTGERCHALTSPGRLRAMTAYFLLMPGIPMLFQGQEFGASSPFFYFADHEIGLSRSVREGRRTFLAQFPSLATSQMQARLTDPGDIETFRRSVLDLSERQRHASVYALHRDLLALRCKDPVLGTATMPDRWHSPHARGRDAAFFLGGRRRPLADRQSRARPAARPCAPSRCWPRLTVRLGGSYGPARLPSTAGPRARLRMSMAIGSSQDKPPSSSLRAPWPRQPKRIRSYDLRAAGLVMARHFLDDFEPHLAEAGIGRSAKSSAP